MTWQSDDLQRRFFKHTLIAACAFAFAGSGMAAAQQTVYVGGSGKPPIEVNMDALDRLIAPYRTRIILDPPGQAPRSVFLLDTPMAATTMVAPVATLTPLPAPKAKPAVTAVVTPTLSPPLPEPVPAVEAAPLTPVVTEPLPEPVLASPPEPAPVPEPVATPQPEAMVAVLTPQAAPAPGEILSIPFAGGSADLPDDAQGNLQAIAAQLAANDTLRAQVKAYADGATGSASSARRLSLSRALSVRSILIEFGVRSTRIDVRALGDRNEGGPPDRVDVLVLNR